MAGARTDDQRRHQGININRGYIRGDHDNCLIQNSGAPSASTRPVSQGRREATPRPPIPLPRVRSKRHTTGQAFRQETLGSPLAVLLERPRQMVTLRAYQIQKPPTTQEDYSPARPRQTQGFTWTQLPIPSRYPLNRPHFPSPDVITGHAAHAFVCCRGGGLTNPTSVVRLRLRGQGLFGFAACQGANRWGCRVP